MLVKISTLEEAEHFIYNYDLFKSKAENQFELFEVLKICERLAIENHNPKLLCNTRIFITGYYTQVNDLENALQLCLKNQKFSEKETLELEYLKITIRLIEIYLSLGDYAQLEELIFLYEQKLVNKNDYSKLCTLNIISAIQACNLKDFEKCLTCNKMAVEYAKLSKDINMQIYAYNNMGYQFINNNLEVSKEALEQALDIIKNNKKKIPLYSIAVVQLNSSRLYLKLGDLHLAKKLIGDSLNKLKRINNNHELNYAKLVLSEIYMATNRNGSALNILSEVEHNCLKQNNKAILVTCYQNFINLYENKKKYRHALEYHKKFQALNEELFNEDSNKKIRSLQILNEVNAIKKQRDHAETIANLKHEFLANMSHEIRTPINSVLGICYLLQQDELSEKQNNYINRLQQSGENLLGLINDILDISKIEADKMELVPVIFNINSLLKEVYNQFSFKAEEKKLKFKLKISPELNQQLKGDCNRLRQILLNLVSNSMKFTKRGSITIEATVKEKIDSKLIVQFNIVDTGIGIANDKLNQIFGRYEQASATIKTQFGGTGLGLSISRKLVELMRGTIEIKSTELKGTCFTVNIPFDIIDAKEIPAQQSQFPTDFLYKKEILIADDNEENRLVMKDIIFSFNNTVSIEEASTGIEVLNQIAKKDFDLVLMDLNMPEKNGMETMNEIKTKKEFENLRIIAHTASLLSMSREDLIEIGFSELLFKPFKPVDLLSKLYFVFKKK